MIADLNVHWDIGEDGMPKPQPMSCLPCERWTKPVLARRSGTGTAPRWSSAGGTLGGACQ